MPNLEERIAAGAAEIGQPLPRGAPAKLERLLAELQRWNRRINLTSIRDPEAMVSGHILDSLSLRPWLEGTRIIDIGTGAGFPGLPLAVAEPEREFVLLDSHGRKISFVKHAIALLQLHNATAVRARAEDYEPAQPFDTLLSRAVAPLAGIAGLAAHLIAESGIVLAQKGKYPATELEEMNRLSSEWNFRVIEVQVPGLPRESRHIVRMTRAGRP